MTHAEAKNLVGVCTLCGEWTSIDEPCCNTGVIHEGHIYYSEDLEEDEKVNDDERTIA